MPATPEGPIVEASQQPGRYPVTESSVRTKVVDVFVSYAREDREWVAPLAESLAARGWSVWWDSQIPPGKTFDQVIEETLDQAKAVIAVWSQNGVESHWVRTEAAEGAAREILVPVLMEPVTLPLAFRRIQAADLTDWTPGEDHPGFTELIGALAELVGDGSIAASAPESPDALQEALNAARARSATQDWEAVIALLEPFEKEKDLAEQSPAGMELLATARRRLEAGELYEEAELLFAEGKWGEVSTRLNRVLELDPSMEAASVLKARAEKHLTDERQLRLEHLYNRASDAVRSRQWPVAFGLLEELLSLEPDHQAGRDLMDRARVGQEVDEGYRRLHALFKDERWEDVVSGVAQLTATDPDFEDTDRLSTRAKEKLEGAETLPDADYVVPESRPDSIDSAKPTHAPRTLVSKLRLALDRAPRWSLAVLAILSAYLPWLNPPGEDWVPGLFLPVNWAWFGNSEIHLGFPIIILGLILAFACRDENRQRLRRGAGIGLIVLAAAQATAALGVGWRVLGEVAASAGPYLALTVGLLARRPAGVHARQHEPSPVVGRTRFRGLAMTLAGVGVLVMGLGLSGPEFAGYESAFDLNGLASFGIGFFFEHGPWIFTMGALVIVVLVVVLAIALFRYRDVLWAPARGAAFILLVLAGLLPLDSSGIQAGYNWTLIGAVILLLAVPAGQIAAGTPPWKKRTS